ncbi:MAG: hypothetical protein GF375_04730 [Candidatus Omnitrophica bacterium]|nr:hypothetical protein [Candidatus Omnitrophota bacterium]MBD3269332.1 hypothetical protein [Candidatus Omnitrophota bacterium]
MVTFFILYEQRRVLESIKEVLIREGYSVFNDFNRISTIRVAGKADNTRNRLLGQKILNIRNYSLEESNLYKTLLREVEKPLIESVLEDTEGNQIKAARVLGINRNTLHSKIKKLGIRVEKFRK